MINEPRAYAPHCDSSILHSPGTCTYCDMYPDWQEYRSVAHICFTDEQPTDGKSPCPSMWGRSPGTRDRWYGNVAITEEPEFPSRSVQRRMSIMRGD